jgi:hypothetical protein
MRQGLPLLPLVDHDLRRNFMSILAATSASGRHWDLAGIGASALCVAHCLATPLLVVALPTVAALEAQTHAVFALTILGIGLLAFCPGMRLHRRWQVVGAALLGFALISLGVVAPEGVLSEPLEEALTVLGGATLILAHLRNAYLCRVCRVCCERGCAAG